MNLDQALTDWKRASRHFDNAANAAIAHDGETFDREMKAFRSISATWKSTREREAGNRLPANQ